MKRKRKRTRKRKRRKTIPRPEPTEKEQVQQEPMSARKSNVNLVEKCEELTPISLDSRPGLLPAGVTCFRGNDRIATTWIYRHSGQA